MNKKNIISIIVIFVLILIIGGIFLWWQRNKGGKQDVYKHTKFENYTIEDTSEGKILENVEANLKIMVLDGWEIEITGYEGDPWVWFFSPGAKFSEKGVLISGVHVWVEINDASRKDTIMAYGLKQDQDTINALLERPEKIHRTDYEVYEIKEISGLKALKTSSFFEINNQERAHISIRLPFEKRLYEFRAIIAPNEESLISEFDEFLEGIEIK